LAGEAHCAQPAGRRRGLIRRGTVLSTDKEHLLWHCPGCPEPPGWTLDFDALVERFDWLRRMDGCPQDPEWHAGGDVLVHVRMVCEALVALRAWRELPEAARHVVFAAALLHDVAKPQFTRVEDGRIRSRGHAVGGARPQRRRL